LLQPVEANQKIADRFLLPPSKVYIEPCERKALLLHPGVIEKRRMLRMLNQQGDYWMEYEIQAVDGPEWLITCDLATGKIIRQQKLVE